MLQERTVRDAINLVRATRSRFPAGCGTDRIAIIGGHWSYIKRDDLFFGTDAHLRVIGKGRKERCTPFAKSTTAVLRSWLKGPQRGEETILFLSARGERLSVHDVQYILNKHRQTASAVCPSLNEKRVTVHRLRHTMAMDRVQADVDRAVIALWVGHESIETTQICLEATLAMKETTLDCGKSSRFRPDDNLLEFLNSP
jgi:integrase